jgi:hypothetical protein
MAVEPARAEVMAMMMVAMIMIDMIVLVMPVIMHLVAGTVMIVPARRMVVVTVGGMRRRRWSRRSGLHATGAVAKLGHALLDLGGLGLRFVEDQRQRLMRDGQGDPGDTRQALDGSADCRSAAPAIHSLKLPRRRGCGGSSMHLMMIVVIMAAARAVGMIMLVGGGVTVSGFHPIPHECDRLRVDIGCPT